MSAKKKFNNYKEFLEAFYPNRLKDCFHCFCQRKMFTAYKICCKCGLRNDHEMNFKPKPINAMFIPFNWK